MTLDPKRPLALAVARPPAQALTLRSVPDGPDPTQATSPTDGRERLPPVASMLFHTAGCGAVRMTAASATQVLAAMRLPRCWRTLPPEAIPAALEALAAACRREEAQQEWTRGMAVLHAAGDRATRPAANAGGHAADAPPLSDADVRPPPRVTLRQLAWPLAGLMRVALASRQPVTWQA